ncbi:ectonucleoside triphosphate diphosphohydrolase 5 isoform X2 [Hypanus sabinus]|uniref:ectonucleoside triphosphate diphosphohydrolase 5 isoform X2 n=1 Tax=Hypanus sabinus TaxID=79690 RepID=UPI0028C48C68|nr:ectonucleoside triphosphate diphosphohydrolase 5 isoform X2 [Hypanus sabinus]
MSGKLIHPLAAPSCHRNEALFHHAGRRGVEWSDVSATSRKPGEHAQALRDAAEPASERRLVRGKMESSRKHLVLASLVSLVYISSSEVDIYHPQYGIGNQDILPSRSSSGNVSNVFYGIVFDAGSTGTRIHIYTFVQKGPEPPQLSSEIFESVKPGLSAYADDPEQGAETVRGLLDIAKQAIPSAYWYTTPVVLKATAGLRLLPKQKAQALLLEIQELFKESPFLVPDDCVSIMNGTYEGILAWITINFLTVTVHQTPTYQSISAGLLTQLRGHLYSANENSVGILDLGGASTQITFLPQTESTLRAAPEEYINSFEMFNTSYKLYSHSYLGFGLKVARLAVLGALETKDESRRYRSSCLPPLVKAEWKFSGVNYKFGGMKEVPSSFQSCYTEVIKVIQQKLDQQDEIKKRSFYAFSYYYDRAVDAGIIDHEKGGVILVKDFELKAEEVCEDINEVTTGSPFLCMDLTYITALLKEGFGFYDDTKLHLAKKVNDIETSWALGAAFHFIQSLRTAP